MNKTLEELVELLLNKIPNYEKSDLLVFSISLSNFEKQDIFFKDDDNALYRDSIEKHISKISKKRYIKITDNEYLFFIKKTDTPIKTIEKRILLALYSSIKIGNYSISIPYIIGSSRYPQDSKNINECIKFARVSRLYLAETSLKHYAKYEKNKYEDAYEEFIIKNTLISAIENNEIEIVFQPIFTNDKKSILSFESLIRWEKNNNFINPLKIITIAEKTESIHLLTEYVTDKVVSILDYWSKKYNSKIPISINISQAALTNPKLPWKLNTILEEYDLSSKLLKIEITETTTSRIFASIDYKQVTPSQISEELITAGFDLYADDFGIGFSNLEFLSSHKFSGIKIDKFFIDKITEKRSKYFLSLIKKIFEFGIENNLKIICEGIETKKQLNLLKKLSKDFYVQGYLFSKPISQEEIEKNYFE